MHDFLGPYFSPDMIGPSGKLSRLHKGASPPPPPQKPAVNKESDALEGAMQLQEDIRRKRGSLAGSFLGGSTGNSGGNRGSTFLGQ